MLPTLEHPVDAPIIFDSHAHYDDEKFDGVRDALLQSLPQYGVCGVISCGCDEKSSVYSVQLCKKYSYFHAAIGIHPGNIAADYEAQLAAVRALYGQDGIVAVGEIGLDYHYEPVQKAAQKAVFAAQLQLAKELDLPVIVHDREAHADTLELLCKYQPRGVVHCFSGSVELAQQVLRLGMYIGLGGAVTFKNARKPLEVAKAVPADRLLLETDAPYMTPVPYRGKVCTSAHIALTAQTIAEARGVSRDALLRCCAQNTRTLFGI